MVSYCCVNGCSNNSGVKKKHSKILTTFHAFPSNTKLREKWLRAIGRPSWEPPTHARVCSMHFTDDQVNREHQRTRLKEDACPIKELPEVLFEPSLIEVCRICLAVDVKMFSLQSDALKICFKNVIGVNKDTEGLPQFACWECAAQLRRGYRLQRRGAAARTALLNLLNNHGQITKHHIKNIDRTKLNLDSSLSFNQVVPKTLIELHYDEGVQKYTHTSVTKENVCKKETSNNELYDINRTSEVDLNVSFTELLDNYRPVYDGADNFVDIKNDIDSDVSEPHCDNCEDIEDFTDDLPLAVSMKMANKEVFVEEKKELKPKKPKKKSSQKNSEGLTPEEVELQEHFNIVIQTLQEQIEERLKMKESAAFRDGLYKCEICYKTYLHPDAYRVHMGHHDPSRGEAECPVCRVRYKTEVLAASHAHRAHGKRFYCRTCPKVFSNVRLAKKHLRRHEGFVYKCDQCEFSSIHESALSAHIRSAHCARLSCAQCGLRFASARGLKLHARAHSDNTHVSVEMWSCQSCGARFSSEEAWRKHCEGDGSTDRCSATQPRPKKMAWKMPGDSYPTDCEYCGERVNNRKEHYFHVRRTHPRERQHYRPVVTAVCDTCGKGFQNSTKLHLHELRHGGTGTVRCPHCPRLFYDKYQLARHAGVHSDARPHACRLCDKAFKLRSNLDRHAKVHSGATPYECTMCGKRFRYSSSRNLHVRTVHYKLPQPPRKKRPKRTDNIAAQ